MVNEVIKAISELSKYCYSYEVTNNTIEEIEEVEKELGLKIADDYRTYLMCCPCVGWVGYDLKNLEDLCEETLWERDRRSDVDSECSPLPDNLYVIRALTDECDYMLQDETGAVYIVDMFFEPIKAYKSLADYIYKEGIPESMDDCRFCIYSDNPVSGPLSFEETDKLIKEDENWLENTMGIKNPDLLCSKEFREYVKDKEISVRECIENYIELKGVENLRRMFPLNKKYPHILMSAYEDTRWFEKFIGGDFWKFVSDKKFNSFINDSHESVRQAMKDYILINGIEKAKEIAGIKKQSQFKKFISGFGKENEMERKVTNRELMECGYAPFNKAGEKIELHQLGHIPGAPIAEVTKTEYRSFGAGNNEISDEEIDREGLARMKRQHWKARVR